jgi:RNA polymerase sigma factor (sigma-70 family)
VLELADEKTRLDLAQAKINDRDREILIRRFGLDGSKPLTLGEIGNSFGISRERVRQIIQEVIQKMRKDYSPELQDA